MNGRSVTGVMLILLLITGCSAQAASPPAPSTQPPPATALDTEPAATAPPEVDTAPAATATVAFPYPEISDNNYKIQVTEVVVSPLTTGDTVDVIVRFLSDDPQLAGGTGTPVACGTIHDASGESWTARELGAVRKDGELLHMFCGFLIPTGATGLTWTPEGYPALELDL